MKAKMLDPERFFDPDPTRRRLAGELYAGVAGLPIVSPHGHVDPRLFVDPQAGFGSPTDLLIIPDHYIFRMLYSQGVRLEELGMQPRVGPALESDHRRIWQIFAEHFYLFRGTPSGVWLAQELAEVFSVEEKLNAANAQRIYDRIAACLESPEYRPRALFERFNIEVLCTTDSAGDSLGAHQALRASGWGADIRPTLRMDGVVNLLAPRWEQEMAALSETSGVAIHSFATFVAALEKRREFFKGLGATATDQGVESAYAAALDEHALEALFERALQRRATPEDAQAFTAHMLIESARMSSEDGLVMQLHVGSIRNHNRQIFERFGADMGADIPQRSEFTHNLRDLLNRFGGHPNFSMILFTLDESTYARELAPLAGHYPALKLGPPWWFHDSLNGIRRYLDQVMETAGPYNTAGFNDDTRAFPSIPARHDVWRRACANWVADLLARRLLDEEDAHALMHDLAYRLARQAYHL